MEDTGVSILIPCRNAAPYLAATLESACGQSVPAAEILVVNDGSTDDSVEIARRFAPKVTVIDGPGRGASAARNQATHQARGRYLQYLDADDLLEPHALATRVDALERTGADLAISDWQRLVVRGSDWQVERDVSGKFDDRGVPADVQVLRGFWAPPAAILYRRSLCMQIGAWRESLPIIQDARFLLDAARLGRVVHVAGIGARYRQHASHSLSTTNRDRFWSDVLRNAEEVESLWRTSGTFDLTHRTALVQVFADCARVGFISRSSSLFNGGLAALSRFAERPESKLVRTAQVLTRTVGYGPARLLLAPFVQ
jgi:glycosyltransferase involved in cell wall biosynthesis